MNNNAAHHANIALHMYLTGDYISLVDRGMDYLDKPHLLFWLAALSYQLIGVTSFAYKFFSFLFALGGIYSTYRLGQLIGGERVGRTAALILATAFAFVLSVNDVRMEAMVVSCIAFSTWQLLEYANTRRREAFFFSALGLALGFATKGAVAVALPVLTLAFYLLQQQKAKELWSLRWVGMVLLTLVFLAPVFYCFYVQFDLHPEKVVRGRAGNSGIGFLLLGQSIQRYTGSGWGSRSSDPLYLVHTFLWAFLPWSVLAFVALGNSVRAWFRDKAAFAQRKETALAATTVLVFVLVSFSRFKNAHYVNVLFPYFAVLTAQYLQLRPSQYFKAVYRLQWVISAGLMLLIGLVNAWAFPISNIGIGMLALLLVGAYLYLSKKDDLCTRAIWMSVTAIVFSYFLLNFNFYPKLLPYQSGHVLAKKIKEAGIPSSRVYYLETNERNYSMDFSLAALPGSLTIDSLKRRTDTVYLFADRSKMEALQAQQVPFEVVLQVPHYNVSTLKFKFLNPSTRAQTLTPHYILRVRNGRS